MPASGANVTVNGNWTIIMDVDPAPSTFLTIDGDVFVSDRDTVIQADSIFIRAGSLNAGNTTSPFKYKLNIILTGTKTGPNYVINPTVAGNKFLVVTGVLSLYGQPPSTVWTQLAAKASAGATTITVASAGGWAVGDELAIAPSFNSSTQYEKVTITAISVATSPSQLEQIPATASACSHTASSTAPSSERVLPLSSEFDSTMEVKQTPTTLLLTSSPLLVTRLLLLSTAAPSSTLLATP